MTLNAAPLKAARRRRLAPFVAAISVVATLVGVGSSYAAQPSPITEYSLPPSSSGGPYAVTGGPDGNVWYTRGDTTGRITPTGVATEFPNGGGFGIAAGPDGNLWSTQGDSILRRTTSGAVTSFPLPNAFSDAIGIAAGPDGNMWFAENQGNRIGRITTSGSLTEFPMPTPNSGPYNITTGRDGNLWFTEVAVNRIGRITPSGSLTEFSLPTPFSTPSGIAAGPDGDIWYAGGDGNQIGRVSPSGDVTQFPLPNAHSTPFGIAAGADGNLWFTEENGNSVGRITPTGAIAEFPLPNSGSVPFYMTSGPDGNVWFTESNGQRLGKVVPPRDAYVPLAPARIFDTRSGSGQRGAGQTIGPNSRVDVQVTGVGPMPPSGVTSVYLNLTATNGSDPSYLTVFPTGGVPPLASNLNFLAHETRPNLVHVPVGVDGKITIYNAVGHADAIVDVEGYTTPATGTSGLFEPLPPKRLVDTRAGSGYQGAGSPLGENATMTFQPIGHGGVPAVGVGAVVLNVTVTGATAPASFLTAFPAGTLQPFASNLNFSAGETVPNRVIVPVGADGRVALYNAAGATDVVVDVGGWFTDGSDPAAMGATMHALAPTRIFDSRAGSGLPGAGGTPQGNSVTPVRVAGVGGVPAMGTAQSPTSVVLNVTVTDALATSFLTVYPSDVTRPWASDLNWGSGQTVPNLVVAKLGSDGAVDVYNAAGRADVIVDVLGYYAG